MPDVIDGSTAPLNEAAVWTTLSASEVLAAKKLGSAGCTALSALHSHRPSRANGPPNTGARAAWARRGAAPCEWLASGSGWPQSKPRVVNRPLRCRDAAAVLPQQ
eukprot:scaffold89413_cov66-Phaeocystis_antarctica.AAC.9